MIDKPDPAKDAGRADAPGAKRPHATLDLKATEVKPPLAAQDASAQAASTDKPAPAPVRQQTHKELRAIVDAIEERKAKAAEDLISDHLMRILATINIWQ